MHDAQQGLKNLLHRSSSLSFSLVPTRIRRAEPRREAPDDMRDPPAPRAAIALPLTQSAGGRLARGCMGDMKALRDRASGPVRMATAWSATGLRPPAPSIIRAGRRWTVAISRCSRSRARSRVDPDVGMPRATKRQRAARAPRPRRPGVSPTQGERGRGRLDRPPRRGRNPDPAGYGSLPQCRAEASV